MTRREGVLLALAAVLVSAAVWQYWPQVPLPGRTGGEAPAAKALAPLTDADLAALAAHPLFSPSRLPEAAAPPPAPALEVIAPLEVVPPAADPVPAKAAVPVLQGVVVTPAPGAVFLADGQGGAAVFLRPGQAAFGLSLEEVFADRATFRTADGEITLPLVQADPAPPAEPVQE